MYGVLKSISSPRRVGPGTFYIIVMLEGASWACRYLLHKDNMMQPIPQGLLERRPLFPGITPMAQWWSNYDEIDREQRVRVTQAVVQLSIEEVKRLNDYMVTRRLASVHLFVRQIQRRPLLCHCCYMGFPTATLSVRGEVPLMGNTKGSARPSSRRVNRECQGPIDGIVFLGVWHGLRNGNQWCIGSACSYTSLCEELGNLGVLCRIHQGQRENKGIPSRARISTEGTIDT